MKENQTHKRYEKILMVGVLFKSGSYVVVRNKNEEEDVWEFPHKTAHWSEKGSHILEHLFLKDFSLKVEQKESICTFDVKKNGVIQLLQAYWIDYDDLDDMKIKSKREYRWVTLEEMLLLIMNDEYESVRSVLANLSFA